MVYVICFDVFTCPFLSLFFLHVVPLSSTARALGQCSIYTSSNFRLGILTVNRFHTDRLTNSLFHSQCGFYRHYSFYHSATASHLSCFGQPISVSYSHHSAGLEAVGRSRPCIAMHKTVIFTLPRRHSRVVDEIDLHRKLVRHCYSRTAFGGGW